MKILKGEKEAINFLKEAGKVAQKATCLRAKCGSIIVKSGKIIGRGFNSPPNNSESQRRCTIPKSEYDLKVTDKTCCVHAEQRAIMDALRKNPQKIKGSTLYFMRLDKNDNLTKAGKPYCTICSKMTLDCGIKYFVLWHADGIYVYDAEEYNNKSFQYKE